MNHDDPLPPLRRVEITPLRDDEGELRFVLHDLMQIAPRAIAVSIHGFFVLSLFDGLRTPRDVQAEFLREFGQAISLEQLADMVASLDDALMLETGSFERAYEARRDEYAAADARDGRPRYPDEEALRRELDAILSEPTGPPVADLCGIVAPHLDYARGEPCYRAAYGALRGAPPADRYVILGTNHFGRSSSVVATTKDFLTPLGRATTDREFIGELESALGGPLCEGEFDHANEHSVELQVQLLQAALDGRPFSIVPVLCPDPCGESPAEESGKRGPSLRGFADALGDLISKSDRRTIVIAGADLSHVGQRFGDEQPTTPEFLERVRSSDTALLSLLEQRREDAFVERVADDENPTRICSVGCIYALLRALPGQPCRVLRYHQAVDMESETHVTCAAAVVGE